MGVDLIGEVRRVEVVVDEDLRARIREHLVTHGSDTLGVVEVGADKEVRGRDDRIACRFLFLIHMNPIRARHPVEESRKSVRNDHLGFPAEPVIERKRRTHGIAIGRHVGEDDDMLCVLQQFFHALISSCFSPAYAHTVPAGRSSSHRRYTDRTYRAGRVSTRRASTLPHMPAGGYPQRWGCSSEAGC